MSWFASDAGSENRGRVPRVPPYRGHAPWDTLRDTPLFGPKRPGIGPPNRPGPGYPWPARLWPLPLRQRWAARVQELVALGHPVEAAELEAASGLAWDGGCPMIDHAPPFPEVTSKKRRGRPRAFTPEELAEASSVFQEAFTRRGLQNAAYALWGMELLPLDGEFNWIFDPSRAAGPQVAGNARDNPMRSGILAELGRMVAAGWPRDEILGVARWVCREKPRTRTAILELRRLRLARPLQRACLARLAQLAALEVAP